MAIPNVAPSPRGRNYVIVFLLVTVLAVVASVIWGLEEGVRADESIPLPPLPVDYSLKDFWFRRDGELSLVLSKPEKGVVAVGNWSRGASQIRIEEVDLLAGLPKGGSRYEARYSHGTRARRAGFTVVPFTVSQDGKTIASVVAGTLYVGNPSKWDKAVEVLLSSSDRGQVPLSPVEALTFSSPSLVTMVHSDGSMDHCDFVKRGVASWSTDLPAPPVLWSRGSRLLVSESADEFKLFEVQRFDATKFGSGRLNLGDQEVTAASISSDGSRLAFGSSDGIVYLQSVKSGDVSPIFPERQRVSVSLPDSRPVKAVSLLDQGGALSGGDFQNIYFVDADLNREIAAETEDEVTLIATRGSDLAYSTSRRRVVVAKIGSRTLLNAASLGWILSIYATTVSILAFCYSLASDQPSPTPQAPTPPPARASAPQAPGRKGD